MLFYTYYGIIEDKPRFGNGYVSHELLLSLGFYNERPLDTNDYMYDTTLEMKAIKLCYKVQ